MLATCSSRDAEFKSGLIFWRAQLDFEERAWTDDNGEERFEFVGHGRHRMVPLAELVNPGRANPEKVAFLYLASTERTAISEMRPWLGAGISVAQFRLKRKLKVLNLTEGHGHFGIEKMHWGEPLNEKPADPKRRQQAVWTDIDAAFSWPVSRSESESNYRPTQVLAQAFRDHGYDGLVYRSNFGDDDPEYNIVLFNPDDAEILNCSPCRVKKVHIEFEEIGNAWHVVKK